MKVIYYIDSLRIGGKERQIVELINGIKTLNKLEVLIVCMDNDNFYLNNFKDNNIQIKYLIRKIRWDPIIFIKLYKIIKDFKPDIIHTNSLMNTFYSIIICKLKKIKIVNNSIRNANSNKTFKWWLELIFLILSDIRLSNSKAGLLSRNLKINNIKNIVIHNGIDLERFKIIYDKKYILKKLNICAHEKIVGMVAEFNNYKDYDTFFKAAEILINKRSDVIFISVGDGINFSYYKNKYEGSKIKFIGKISKVEEIINIFDVGVLSTFGEGISNAVMEYMALSKPVIVTKGGGSNEIVINNKTGYIINNKTPINLANKIDYLISNPSICNIMGKLGRDRIINKFNLETMVNKTIDLYRSLIEIR